jgi:initiation factor 1A
MVKNANGGCKAKGQARKFITASTTSYKLRVSESADEIYAKVVAVHGNGMLEVLCIDKAKRLCHIRGKFRGRGKRDNFISRESWILVGKRDWESDEVRIVKGKTKLPNCDLLEVYSDADISRLKSNVDEDWSIFITEVKKEIVAVNESVEFVAEDTISQLDIDINPTSINIVLITDDDKINVDDI